MRTLLFLALFAITACSPGSYSLVRPQSDRFASLQITGRPGVSAWENYHGIWSIGDHKFPKALTSSIYVLEGTRLIGYACPGWLFVDAPPQMTYTFIAGKSYRLDCSGTPQIREAIGGT